MANKKFLLLPFLFSAYFALFLYSINLEQVSFPSLIRGMIFCIAAAFFFLIFAKVLVADYAKAGLIASSLVFLFFSFGHIQIILSEIISKHLIRKTIFGFDNYVAIIHLFVSYGLVVFDILFLLILIKILNKKNYNIAQFIKILSSVIIFLLLATSFEIGLRSAPTNNTGANRTPVHASEKTDNFPDIYYIILDGYGREDVLSRHYGFDNREFLSALEKRGFFVAPNSYSNYSYTFLSLASSLNMEYINYLSDNYGRSSNDISATYDLIENNKVVELLKSKGYTYVHFNSTWGATLKNRNSDIAIDSVGSGIGSLLSRDEFIRMVVNTTPLKLVNSYWSRDLAKTYLTTLEQLKTVPSIDKSTFTFVHFLPPHHPYLFDRDGNIQNNLTMFNQFQLTEEGGTKWMEKDSYVDQLIFVNNKIIETIDVLLAESDRPPIIIIQSDHGPQISNDQNDEYIQARLRNLTAINFPNKGNEELYDSITPVNIFRILSNYYLGENFDVLDDKTYYSSYATPYDFNELGIQSN